MIDTSWADVGPVSDVNVQGSEAWLKWRGKGLGSSDAAVLLGWSPWKNVTQLWEEKLGLWKPEFGWAQKKAMDRGKELEPKIRKWYEHQADCLFTEAIAEDPVLHILRASFDGINKDFKNEDDTVGKIIEIKAPNAKDHELAKLGEITDKYRAQVQWLMMIARVQWCDYVSYGSDDTYAVVPIPADPMMQKELRERAELFWKHIETKTPINHWDKWEREHAPVDLSKIEEPAQMELLTPEVNETKPTIDEQGVEGLVAKAIEAQREMNVAEGKFEALKDLLKQALGTDEKRECGEATFGWQKRKGTVDYSIIPELIGLDLDQFRKPDTKAFYFKRK